MVKYNNNLDLQNIIYFCDVDLIEKTEQWKDVVGYEGLYQVSDLGRIKSLNYNKTKQQKILKQTLGNNEYLSVCLYGFKKWKKTFSVHRIVAENFIKNAEIKKQVNHKNGTKTDNRTINLEWATASENGLHAYKNGLSNCAKGESYKSKLTEKQVLEIRSSNLYQKELSLKYNISIMTISDIKRRKSWKHI